MYTEGGSRDSSEHKSTRGQGLTSIDGRLDIRLYCLDDVDDLFSLIDRNREHFSQHAETTGLKYRTPAEVADSITNPPDRTRMRFSIRESGILVGAINLTPKRAGQILRGEVGYLVGAEFGGRGIATEAVRTMTDFGLRAFAFEELFGIVAVTNIASRRVLEKVGYTELRQFEEFDRRYSEMVTTR